MPLRTQDFAAVLAGAQPRCMSIYQQTHRHLPDAQHAPILDRSQTIEPERTLLEQSLEADVANFLEPFDALEHDVEYWSKLLEGH